MKSSIHRFVVSRTTIAHSTLAIGLLSIISASATFAQATKGDTDAVKKAIQNQYGHMQNAYKKRDVMEMVSVVSPDSKQRGMMIMNMSRMLRAITPVSLNFSIDKIDLPSPDKAVCTVTMLQKYVMGDRHGQFGPRGVDHNMVIRGVQNDTWVKTGSTWMLSSYAEKREKPVITMDGKPFPPVMPHKPGPRRP